MEEAEYSSGLEEDILSETHSYLLSIITRYMPPPILDSY